MLRETKKRRVQVGNGKGFYKGSERKTVISLVLFFGLTPLCKPSSHHKLIVYFPFDVTMSLSTQNVVSYLLYGSNYCCLQNWNLNFKVLQKWRRKQLNTLHRESHDCCLMILKVNMVLLILGWTDPTFCHLFLNQIGFQTLFFIIRGSSEKNGGLIDFSKFLSLEVVLFKYTTRT